MTNCAVLTMIVRLKDKYYPFANTTSFIDVAFCTEEPMQEYLCLKITGGERVLKAKPARNRVIRKVLEALGYCCVRIVSCPLAYVGGRSCSFRRCVSRPENPSGVVMRLDYRRG